MSNVCVCMMCTYTIGYSTFSIPPSLTTQNYVVLAGHGFLEFSNEWLNMSHLISEWREGEEKIEPEEVLEDEIGLNEIRDSVQQMSEAEKKNFLYRLLAKTHGRGRERTQDELSSAICSTIRILRHYEKLKEQRSKFGIEEGGTA